MEPKMIIKRGLGLLAVGTLTLGVAACGDDDTDGGGGFDGGGGDAELDTEFDGGFDSEMDEESGE